MVLPTHSGPVRVVAHAEGMAADASGRAARRVMVEPAGEEDQDADGGRIEILGIRGALEVLIQPGTGVPLEISGDVKAAGHVTAHLEKWAPCAP